MHIPSSKYGTKQWWNVSRKRTCHWRYLLALTNASRRSIEVFCVLLSTLIRQEKAMARRGSVALLLIGAGVAAPAAPAVAPAPIAAAGAAVETRAARITGDGWRGEAAARNSSSSCPRMLTTKQRASTRQPSRIQRKRHLPLHAWSPAASTERVMRDMHM